YGRPENARMTGEELYKTVLLEGPGARDGSLTVDLTNETRGGLPVAAFCAETPADPNDAIPLWEEEPKPEPWKYWKFVPTDNAHRLKITQNNFYLLKSKERIWVPAGIAIYCRASDETRACPRSRWRLSGGRVHFTPPFPEARPSFF